MWELLARCTAAVGALAMIAGAGACTPAPARVTLQPVADNPCGMPGGSRNVRITAYGDAGETTRALTTMEEVDFADFPPDTVQFGVEVEVGAGAIGAIGKSALLAFDDLEDRTTIRVFMAPPNGFCPTVGQMSVERIAPIVARAGPGVLVLGGHDKDGGELASAEYYDMATGVFAPVIVPEVLGEGGFAGTSAATLPDGRVAITGGPRPVITLFDPTTRAFGESVLIESRSFHTSIAIDRDHLLVAGGCSGFVGAVCVPRKSSKVYELASLGMFEIGPNLRVARVGAQIFDIGPQRDGDRGFIVAGGASPSMSDGADLVQLGHADAVAISATRGQAAALDGGAVLTAFDADGAPADGTATVIAPGVEVARAIMKAPDRDGARLVDLEDGRVAAFGGDPGGHVLLYDSTLDHWDSVTPAGDAPVGTLTGASLVRLADGSILVLGALVAGAPTSQAWIYRPTLVGATSGSVVVNPGSTSTILTPIDPATVTRTPDWALSGTDVPARALVGGPRMATGSVLATVRVREGGVALVAQQTGPGRALLAQLVPGEPARLLRTGRVDAVVCTGAMVPALAADTPVIARLEVQGGSIRLVLDGTTLATCSVDVTERGAWGVAALAHSRVVVDTVTVAR